MAVRNFWAEAKADGYRTELRGGPRGKDGGMEITLYQRNHGGIETAVKINCHAWGEALITDVYVNGELCGRYETER